MLMKSMEPRNFKNSINLKTPKIINLKTQCNSAEASPSMGKIDYISARPKQPHRQVFIISD